MEGIALQKCEQSELQLELDAIFRSTDPRFVIFRIPQLWAPGHLCVGAEAGRNLILIH